MITIFDNNLNPLTDLTKYDAEGNKLLEQLQAIEEINASYDLDFRMVLDQEKSEFIRHENIIGARGQYFDIVYLNSSHDDSGHFIEGTAEHVSYRLNRPEYDTEYFTYDGEAPGGLEKILEGTPFTAGEVFTSDVITFSIKEEMTRRSLLIEYAKYLDGELEYDGFTVHIRERRGEDKQTPVTIGRNIIGINKEVDFRDGELETGYQVDLVELAQLPEYKESGLADLEQVNLGDDIDLTDQVLGIIEVWQRIISKTEDLLEGHNSDVEIANFSQDLADNVTQIERQKVEKDKAVNGVRISEEFGFRAIRHDEKFRSTQSADEISMESKTNGSWDYVFRADEDGNLRITGILEASEFIGGRIEIGDDFEVNEAGELTATAAYIDGIIYSDEGQIGPWEITEEAIKTGKFEEVGSKYFGVLGLSISDIFKVNEAGELTATAAYIEGTIEASDIIGSVIEGGIIEGAKIRTFGTGERIELEGNQLNTYNSYNEKDGVSIEEIDGWFGYYVFDKDTLVGGLTQEGGPLFLYSANTRDFVIAADNKLELYGIYGAEFTSYVEFLYDAFFEKEVSFDDNVNFETIELYNSATFYGDVVFTSIGSAVFGTDVDFNDVIYINDDMELNEDTRIYFGGNRLASGSFDTADEKTVYVSEGLITIIS